ncbi:amidohydrolase family protein [Granulicella sp. S190]|uniref:amidohydrolase family protein n=1 Tax=Granulicella sp. S190 TaxID=1747226 RepID=UPI00131C220A|nr:amidohydrolase family protein [Granulicella sp. S190]
MNISTSHLLAIFFFVAGVRMQAQTATPGAAAQTQRSQYLQSLSKLNPIDAHAHVWKSDPAFTAMLERLNLHILDILYVDDKHTDALPLNPQRADALEFVRSAHGHASLCTTFDPFLFDKPDFAKNAVGSINDDFAKGAVAVKVWKNVGMELKDESGHYVMVDDPRLEPIYRDIEAHNKTLIAHQAEPDVAWGPSDPKALDSSYYATHPEWNMEKIPDAPSKKVVLASRDHLLEEHPKLRVVGAHLGSMEADVDMVARTLDRYPNFAVDTGARVAHLTIQPSSKVRAFLIKYQDRVLYGTDIEFSRGDLGSAIVKEWETQLALDWRYFATADTFDYEGRTVHGLNLSPDVLKKIYHSNAVHWFPGIDAPLH